MTNGGDRRQGAWSVRRGRRRLAHATIAMFGRALVSTVIVLGGLSAAAILGPLLDRRGLPGGLFAAAILLVLVAISLRIVLGDLPPRGRRRMLGREAKRRGLKLRIRPRVPRSLRSSPSFSDERTRGADVWHLIAFPGDPPVLTFDRRVERQDPHATPTWWARRRA